MAEFSSLKKLTGLTTNAFGSSENPWISKVEAATANFCVADDRGIELDSVRDIYSRRSRRNREHGGPIEGFEPFLKNLDKVQTQRVLVHNVKDRNGREYCIFTDGDIEELIAILQFPVVEK